MPLKLNDNVAEEKLTLAETGDVKDKDPDTDTIMKIELNYGTYPIVFDIEFLARPKAEGEVGVVDEGGGKPRPDSPTKLTIKGLDQFQTVMTDIYNFEFPKELSEKFAAKDKEAQLKYGSRSSPRQP